MALTVLSLLQKFAYEMGSQVPSSHTSDLRLLNIFYATNREILKSRAFPQSKRTYTFETVIGQDSYQLPGDFYSGLLSTQYNRTTNWSLVGPLSDDEWNFRLYETGGANFRTAYRIFGRDNNSASSGGQLVISPTPSSEFTIGFDYISATTILPPAWAASQSIAQNAYRHVNGEIYQKTDAGTETSGSTAPSHTTGSQTINSITYAHIGTTYDSAQSDSDIPLFDEDLLLNGMKSNWSASKEFDPSYFRMLFEKGITEAVSRWTGGRVGNFSRRAGLLRSRERWSVPDGGWSY